MRDIQTFREMSGEGKRETEKYRESKERDKREIKMERESETWEDRQGEEEKQTFINAQREHRKMGGKYREPDLTRSRVGEKRHKKTRDTHRDE